MTPKSRYIATFLGAIVAVVVFSFVVWLNNGYHDNSKILKVGFVYIGDEGSPYTENFIRAERAVKEKYGDKVEILVANNVSEGKEREPMERMIYEGCSIIFTNSYGFESTAKELAALNPKVQICQATGDNANQGDYVPNYHTFMGTIYQGRYVSGVVAGLKLKDLIARGAIDKNDAKIGYVAAYPFPEVISGYTAFFLGVRSIVPEATMKVKYLNTWSNYKLEKKCAEEFIAQNCVIIAQHSDTTGPAAACEHASAGKTVFHVGYNQDMRYIAPTSSLISARINWTPYILGAVEAVMDNKKIEDTVKGNVFRNDVAGGFNQGWVEMMELNEASAAPGTAAYMKEVISNIKKGVIQVFSGKYIGVNPSNSDDIINLRTPYLENSASSSPTFKYVLKDVIEIVK